MSFPETSPLCCKCPKCGCSWIMGEGWLKFDTALKLLKGAKCPNCGRKKGLLMSQNVEDIERAVRPKQVKEAT